MKAKWLRSFILANKTREKKKMIRNFAKKKSHPSITLVINYRAVLKKKSPRTHVRETFTTQNAMENDFWMVRFYNFQGR